MNIIEIKNVTKTYKSGNIETQAVKGISFSVEKGEFLAIMGPSGSGKSTLMHIIGALDTPTSGDYFLDGKKVSTLSDDELADIRKNEIGFVFQSFNLLPRTTVLRNVTLPLLYSKTPKEEREKKAATVLDLVGLPKEHWSHLSNQLSGGQMQRVAIARALVDDPSIILADEPTGNLDTKTGDLILSSFQELNEKHGRTIILITHELYVAEHADRIISIRDGVIESDKQVLQKRRVNK